MSSAIVKFEEDPSFMIYWKDHAYPAGLGFDLIELVKHPQENHDFFEDTSHHWTKVDEVPHDIQYEYVIKKDQTVSCRECWFTPDVAYHGGGFRYGGSYDLEEWQEKIKLQEKYSYRRPEAWL